MTLEMTEVKADGTPVAGGIHLSRIIDFVNCYFPSTHIITIPHPSGSYIDLVQNINSEFLINLTKCGLTL